MASRCLHRSVPARIPERSKGLAGETYTYTILLSLINATPHNRNKQIVEINMSHHIHCMFVAFCKILLDSAIDLEVPAEKTSGFVSYVFPTPDDPTPRLLKLTIPIHGRYHEASSVGKTFTSVDIQPPELLLRDDKCKWVIFILWPHMLSFSETSN